MYLMMVHRLAIAAACWNRRRAICAGVVVAVVWANAGFLRATPPSLPPTNFHPFGPPTQLIPDGSVVPLGPPKAIATMSPLFMMPQEPFGHLGQNFGALGGTLNIEQKQSAPHRQPIELVPPRGAAAGKNARTAGGAGGAAASNVAPHRSSTIPMHRRPLGW